jgi:sugar phosphate permease
MNSTKSDYTVDEKRLLRRAAWRLLPFLMLCYLVSFIDRINIGFASFQMNRQLHISPEAFGLGGGLFFISYFLFEVPSNLFLEKVGARTWLARIMIVWGIIAALMAAVQGAKSFLAMRFLLGAAEAGFFPGVILYLTYWFPKAYRARMISWFAVAIPMSGFLGSPISAELLSIRHFFGLQSWQWLYLIEGIPAILLGIGCLFVLPNKPDNARWMSPEERLAYGRMLNSSSDGPPAAPVPFLAGLRHIFDRQVLLFAVVLAGTTAVSSAYAIWTPRLIKSFAWSNGATGWLNSAPFLLGAIAMVLLGATSDRSRERLWHTAGPLFVSALASIAISFFTGFAAFYILVNIAIIGIYACKGPAWATVTEWLPKEAQASGIAQVNALSNLVGFGTVYAVGVLRQATGGSAVALLPLGVLSALAAIVVIVLNASRKKGSSLQNNMKPELRSGSL